MFIECSKKVAQKNAQNPLKGTTDILNELLADESWLAQVSFLSSLFIDLYKKMFNPFY